MHLVINNKISKDDFAMDLSAILVNDWGTWADWKETRLHKLFSQCNDATQLTEWLTTFYIESTPDMLVDDELEHVSRISSVPLSTLQSALEA